MERSQSPKVTVTVKYLSVLRDRTGLRHEAVALPAGSRLDDLARWLEERHGFVYGDRQLMFILNGRGWAQHPRGLETPLAEGDTVLLSMPVSGG
jgi:molybdopterin converting factor small subunit